LSYVFTNIIYISFIGGSFAWLFLSGFVFKKLDIASHSKMFAKNYTPSNVTIDKSKFKRKGIKFIILIWLMYLVALSICSILNIITWQLFLMGACVMFILNSIFTRKFCLLSLLVLHNKNNCCRNCGINGWDYAIFASSLIFAPRLSIVSDILNIIILLIALAIFIIWEYTYHKYPERFYQNTNLNLSCINCNKDCLFKKKIRRM